MRNQSTRRRPSYQLDGLVICMFGAVIFDLVTTYYGLTRLPAVEANPVLAPLLKQSFVWLAVYGFIRPMLLPFVPKEFRRIFTLFFLVAHIYGGINNSGMLFFTYSITNHFGYWIPAGLLGFGTLAMFVYELVRYPKNRWVMVGWTIGILAVFLLIEGAFYLIGIFASE